MAHALSTPRINPAALSRDQLTKEIDREAVRLARAVIAGDLIESEARWEIAALVTSSGIPDAVASSIARSGHHQDQVDTAQLLTELIQDKIAGPRPALDLAILAEGKSVSGWTRKFCNSTASRSTAHRLSARVSERCVPISNDDQRLAALAVGLDGTSSWEEHESNHDEAFLALAAAYQEQSAFTRSYERIHLSTRYLCAAFGLPTPCRGIDLPNYQVLKDRLGMSGTAALDDIIDTVENPDGGYRGLAQLFAHVPIDELALFANLPAKVAHRIALSALTPTPPPHQAHLRAMRDDLAGLVGGKHAAGRLVNSWVSVRTEVDRSEYGVSGHPKIRSVDDRRRSQEQWASMVASLVRGGVTQLGLTPDAVRVAMERIIDDVVRRQAA